MPYYVYITTNLHRTVLYTGVTNNPERRLNEHIADALNAKRTFAGKYQCSYLLYLENFQFAVQAIAREKEIKKWSRAKKIRLIQSINPRMEFLNSD